MLSILINAYACSPGMGSEPGMAWNWCVNLARYCELHIITEGEFRDKIEDALPALPQGGNMHFYYNPVSDEIRRMCWNQGDWRFYYYYDKWQKKTLQMVKEMMKTQHVDVIHQLNMVGFREPGYLWKLDKPFVWGPIAGIGSIPVSFLKEAGLKFRLFFALKNQITKWQLKYDRKVNGALKKANVLITATPEAGEAVKLYHHKDSILINETGCSFVSGKSGKEKFANTFDVLWVGRFIYTKQLKLALDTIAGLKNLSQLRFHIVGQAFNEQESQKYHDYATSIGLSTTNCIWYGQIPNGKVHELMQRCHLFFFSSIFEATSTVILEAIQNGLPILCFNRCGFGPIVDETIGQKIEMTTPKAAVSQFAQKLTYFYQHREVLEEMSLNCAKRQAELSWDAKARRMVQLYEEISAG